ncbi:MAG TPA: hypothetical protein VFE37_06275 [Chloroflexota bacterium]|nr:hypothetical protein [Chloroflexota bacterium]
MTSPFSRLLARRLRGRLICRLVLRPSEGGGSGPARELVVVLSPSAPYLRRLTVYRRLAAGPTRPPRAA